MGRIYVGLDNGVSGSIGIVGDDIESFFCKTPVKKVQDYTKAVSYTHLDVYKRQIRNK